MAQHPLITTARRMAAAAAATVAGCHQARRRCVALALAPDRQLVSPNRAPETYAEFLFRTSGPLEHEPAAGARRGPGR